ncbi:hypothetical protein MLD38_029452 [Melastoma candidum]|uniref:Uncharacterized protein n=1 Tax=Melastoma candidum TaxID=119954 RepID=A0ACB9N9J1_9MYRT|nr:hypothetical protein MLD38_029452 [Melastoma candidum]
MTPTARAAAVAAGLPAKRRDRTTLASLFSNQFDATDINSWNSIIADLSRGGDSVESLRAFASLRSASPVSPNRHTFPCALKSCSSLLDLFSGRQIHQQAVKFGYSSDLFVSSSLIDVYSKCGETRDARMVFEEMPVRNVVCWTSMINGFFLRGQLREGMSLFRELLAEESKTKDEEGAGIVLDPVAVGSVVSASGDAADYALLTSIHALVVRRGFEEDSAVGNTLMDAYGKCGYINATKKLFGWMIEKDSYSWNVMISSYAQSGMAEEALGVFTAMVEDSDCDYTPVTLSAVLLACSHLGALRAGRCVHDQVVKMNLEDNVVVGTNGLCSCRDYW